MKSMFKNCFSLALASAIISILGMGCASTQKEQDEPEEQEQKEQEQEEEQEQEQEEGDESSHHKPTAAIWSFDLKNGQKVIYDQATWQRKQRPWPNSSIVWRKILDEESLMSMSMAFEAWDFNGDGRVNMVVKVGPIGKVEGIAYDFDGDGRIDRLLQSKEATAGLSSP